MRRIIIALISLVVLAGCWTTVDLTKKRNVCEKYLTDYRYRFSFDGAVFTETEPYVVYGNYEDREREILQLRISDYYHIGKSEFEGLLIKPRVAVEQGQKMKADFIYFAREYVRVRRRPDYENNVWIDEDWWRYCVVYFWKKRAGIYPIKYYGDPEKEAGERLDKIIANAWREPVFTK